MHLLRRGLWFGGLLAVVAAVGCAASDPGITTAVKTKLAADDTVKAYQIDVDTKDGVVTLNGTVDSPAAKERAISVTRTTDGVRNVVDNLRVVMPPQQVPPSGVIDSATGAVTDAAITTAVKTRLGVDPAVSALKIDVDTKDGVVSLTGTVKTAAEKQRAVTVARDTTGVKSVTDNLKVGR